MPTTLQNIGDAALRIIGQMGAPGRGSSPEEQAEYLFEFNGLIDQFNSERLMIYEISRNAYALTTGDSAYTMGPSGASPNLTSVRPARIENLSIFFTSLDQEFAMKIVSYAEFSRLAILPTAQGIVPTLAWIDYGFPNLTVNMWPVPGYGFTSLAVYAWVALTGGFTSVTQTIAFPPGYQELFEYGMALVLAPRYKKPIQEAWVKSYQDARAAVMKINQQTLPLEQLKLEVPAGDPPPDSSLGAGDAA